MERFNVKNFSDVEVKEQYQVKVQIGLQLWKAWMMMMMMMMMTTTMTTTTRVSVSLGKERGYKSSNHRGCRLLWVETAWTILWWI